MSEATDLRLPTGTVTFMFTDIEGSTRILRRLGDVAYKDLIESHDDIVRSVLHRHRGVEVATEGDSFFAVFVDVVEALAAALEIQSRIAEHEWGDEAAPKVRIGLHTGQGILGGANYVGVDVHKASRVASAANGGQVLVSDITAHLVEDRMPDGVTTQRLGRFRIAGFDAPLTIFQLDSGPPVAHPPLRADPAESRLPVVLSEFVGREAEIEAAAALSTVRLLTLTGPGGTGKTRLSIEIARRLEPDFDDGAVFVILATIRDPDLIPATILQALGLKTAGGIEPIDHLKRYLADKEILLVLDNFEQLTDGAATVARLLEAAPRVKVIVSSRVPLRIAAEHEFPVPPLDTPDPGDDPTRIEDSAGVRLFIERARGVKPAFSLDQGNLRTVATITRALDGLPLAIELAASRIRSLTPEAILERLGNQLLSVTAGDRPERQQTITNAIGWSYDLLQEPERRLFETLSVFLGTFALSEVEKVCTDHPDVLDGIDRLVDHSLLRQTEEKGEPRYRMLTVIREFGYAALVARGDEDEVVMRHTAAYLDLAGRAHAEILTSAQVQWLERLDLDHDNLRAVFDRAIARGDKTTALRLAALLWRFWQIKGHLGEGLERIEKALAMPGETDPVVEADALTALAGIRYWAGRWVETEEPYIRALEIYRSHGDDAQVSEALYNLSFPLGYAGRVDEGRALLAESLEISERIGRRIGVGRALWGLANMDIYVQQHEAGIEFARRSAEVFETLDAPFDLGWSWFIIAGSQAHFEDVDAASSSLLKALELFSPAGDISAIVLIIELAAAIMVLRGEDELGAFLAGATARIKEDTGIEIGSQAINQYPVLVQFLAMMNEEAGASWEEGRASSIEEAVHRTRQGLAGGAAGQPPTA